jgi:hypothetical protein
MKQLTHSQKRHVAKLAGFTQNPTYWVDEWMGNKFHGCNVTFEAAKKAVEYIATLK